MSTVITSTDVTISPAHALAQSIAAIHRAARARAAQPRGIYTDTALRAQYRKLIDAAGAIPGTQMVISFIKNDLTLRTMKCTSIGPDSDYTARYVTVRDTEAGDFRRVALDSIVELSLKVSS